MSRLLCNIPPVRVWVRKEYLYDLRKGHGEYTPGFFVSCKSIPGRALYFETYLPEYGATFDKLPISAFLSFDSDHPDKPETPTPDLPIGDLQYWNGFDYGVTCIEKNLLYNMEWEVRTRENGTMKGTYLFTLDNYHSNRDDADLYFSEVPEEHKSHNVIELSNGQIGCYPNNRCRMTDASLSNENLKTPDFLVSTRIFDVECNPKWGRLGESQDYYWETLTEKKAKKKPLDRTVPSGISLEPFDITHPIQQDSVVIFEEMDTSNDSIPPEVTSW